MIVLVFPKLGLKQQMWDIPQDQVIFVEREAISGGKPFMTTQVIVQVQAQM